MNKTIILDTRWIRGKKIDGIGRVCFSYVKEIINHNYNFILLYYNDYTKSMLLNIAKDRPNVSLVKVPFDILSLKDFVFLPKFLSKIKADFYLSFNYLSPIFRIKQNSAVFIHDFIPYLLKEEFLVKSLKWKLFFGRKWLIKRMLFLRDHIFSVSNSTKNDAIVLFDVLERKISVVYNASTFDSIIKEKSPFKSSNHGKFILYVGRKDKYKNVETVVQSFIKANTGSILVICGPADEHFFNSIKNKFSNESKWSSIIFLDNVSDAELLYLYKKADVLINISLYEGFGLPVLEAMSFGTPVICSDISSLLEVSGNAAYVVSPMDIPQIAEAMENVLTKPSIRLELAKKGLKRSLDFSWTKSSDIIMEKIREVV